MLGPSTVSYVSNMNDSKHWFCLKMLSPPEYSCHLACRPLAAVVLSELESSLIFLFGWLVKIKK